MGSPMEDNFLNVGESFLLVIRIEEAKAKMKYKTSMVRWSGNRSYARVVEKEGPRK